MSLTLLCNLDDYHGKGKGDLIIKLIGNKNDIDKDELITLNYLTGKKVTVNFEEYIEEYSFIEEAPKKKSKKQDDEDQLTFLSVQCPDCKSFDCNVAETLAICNTCQKEFALPPELRKIKNEQVQDLMEIAREIYTAKTESGDEFIEWEDFFIWIEGLINRTISTDCYEPITLSALSQADFETIINHYNLLIQAEQPPAELKQVEEVEKEQNSVKF